MTVKAFTRKNYFIKGDWVHSDWSRFNTPRQVNDELESFVWDFVEVEKI